MKNNFFSGRKFNGEKDVKERLSRWNARANPRIHNTTRKVPREVFEKEERIKLIPLPQEEYKLVKVWTAPLQLVSVNFSGVVRRKNITY